MENQGQSTPFNANQDNGFGQQNGYGHNPQTQPEVPEASAKGSNRPSGSGLLSKWKAGQEPNANAPGSGVGNAAQIAPNQLSASQSNWASPQPQPQQYSAWQMPQAAPTSQPQYYTGAGSPFSPMPGSLPAGGNGNGNNGFNGNNGYPAAPAPAPAPMMPGIYSHTSQITPGQQTNIPGTSGSYAGYGPGTGNGAPYPQGNPAYGQMPSTARPGGPMPMSAPNAWQAGAAYNGPPPFIQAPPGAYGNGPGRNGNNERKKKRRFPIWSRVALGFLLFLLILTGSGLYYYYANFAAPVSKITGQTVTRLKGDSAPQGRNYNPTGGILSGGRINILLLGSDDDYKSRILNGGVLAQTDIVVSIDPASKTVSMLSIPRDSWVNVPGFGMHKLDEAYLLGGGGANGAALSMATIHQDFGIYINQYAWVGLSGFVNVINTVGGIDMDLIHPITDDAYPDDTGKGATDPYAYKRLYLAPGPQHLDGLTALEYVRSRHADLVGDFGRSVRQQQILDQLKYKLDNPNIIGELPALANDLAGSVKTSMQLSDVFNLMYFAKSLSSGSIHNYTLGPPYSTTATITNSQGNGDSIVVLDCSKVQPLIAQIFALGGNAACGQVDTNNPYTIPDIAPQTPATGSTGQIATPAAAPASTAWQPTNSMPNIGSMSLSNTLWDLTGIHSLLDLMFAVVFESPYAMLV